MTISKARKLRNLLWSYWYRTKCDILEFIAKNAPHIPTRKPKFESMDCPDCGKPMTKICAYNTGDGWLLFRECENYCGTDEEGISNWWPFWFGAYANSKQLSRVGIEEV